MNRNEPTPLAQSVAVPAQPLVVHGTELSGHTHRAILMLSLLGLPYRLSPAPADIRRSAAFRKLNPLGQIPVLQDGELVIADSTAILVYLAKQYAPDSHWLPHDAVGAAHVQQWLSIASGEVRFGPAAARLMRLWGAPGDRVQIEEIAANLLQFMEAHLAERTWLAAEHPTIADVAVYPYVAHAPEGGIALEPYGAVRNWLARIEALPRFLPMPRS